MVQQDRVKNVFNTLRLQDKLDGTQDEGASLPKVYKTITKHSRQVFLPHRGAAHEIEYLRNAFIGYEWSTEPFSRIATRNLSFEYLFGDLEAPYQLKKEEKLANIRDNINFNKSKSDEDKTEITGIYGKFDLYLNNADNLQISIAPK